MEYKADDFIEYVQELCGKDGFSQNLIIRHSKGVLIIACFNGEILGSTYVPESALTKDQTIDRIKEIWNDDMPERIKESNPVLSDEINEIRIISGREKSIDDILK